MDTSSTGAALRAWPARLPAVSEASLVPAKAWGWGYGAGQAVGDARERWVQMGPVGGARVGHHEHRLADRRAPTPAVGEVELVTTDHARADVGP